MLKLDDQILLHLIDKGMVKESPCRRSRNVKWCALRTVVAVFAHRMSCVFHSPGTPQQQGPQHQQSNPWSSWERTSHHQQLNPCSSWGRPLPNRGEEERITSGDHNTGEEISHTSSASCVSSAARKSIYPQTA